LENFFSNGIMHEDNWQVLWGVTPIQLKSRRFLEPDLALCAGKKPESAFAETGCFIQWVVDETVLTTSTSVMPQMGQLPGVSRTTSGCIGQVYFTVWLPLAANSDVLQPVKAGITAPSTSVISAIVIQLIFFIFISSHHY
jgi:hypothetical protein